MVIMSLIEKINGILILEICIGLVYLMTILFLILRWNRKRKSKLQGISEAEQKGMIGETEVAGVLSLLPASQYAVFHNLILKTETGDLTQIDHLIVSSYGIFVIETKNYSGFITGGDNSEQWQESFYGKKSYQFHNPVKQNYAHVKAILHHFHFSKRCIIPIVAFSDQAILKVNTQEKVIHFQDLALAVLEYQTERFTLLELSEIIQKLQVCNMDSEKNRAKLIAQIEKNVLDKEKNIQAGYCPRCSGKLIKRSGKYGEFYGCSRYPKCWFTQNITSDATKTM